MFSNCAGVCSSVASVMVAVSRWVAGRRRAAQLATGDLHVLVLDRGRDIDRRQREAVQLVGVEPDPHRVLRAEHVEIAHPVDSDSMDSCRFEAM